MSSRYEYVAPPLRERLFKKRYLLGHPLPQPAHPRRTICTSAMRMSRFYRVKIRYPDWVLTGTPPPIYDLDLARELLERTSELPDDPGGMVILNSELRYALGALVRAASAGSPESAPGAGDVI
jgi:hypothetical protein